MSKLGFTNTYHSEQWKVFAAQGDLPGVSYFAINEDHEHTPNDNMIGFWANDYAEVDRITELVKQYGGTINTVPSFSRSAQPITPYILKTHAAISMKWFTD